MFEFTYGSFFKSCIDFVDRRMLPQGACKIGERPVEYGHTDAGTTQFAIKVWKHARNGFCCAGCRWDDRRRSCACAAEIPVGAVVQALIARHAMYRGNVTV